MQNMNIKSAIENRVLMCAYSPKTLQGFLDLEDLAQVARVVLLGPAPHNRARYELVGENKSLEDVAKSVSRVSGVSSVSCQLVSRSEILKRGIIHANVDSDYTADALDRMLYYYDKRCGSVKLARMLCVELMLMHDVLVYSQGHSWEQQYGALVARAGRDELGGLYQARAAEVDIVSLWQEIRLGRLGTAAANERTRKRHVDLTSRVSTRSERGPPRD